MRCRPAAPFEPVERSRVLALPNVTLSVMQEAPALTRIAYELAEDARSENVRYLEVRFSPVLHGERGALQVGSLLGVKTVINEFVAYLQLAGDLEAGPRLEPRSIVIATYALSGFANFSSIAIQSAGSGGSPPRGGATSRDWGCGQWSRDRWPASRRRRSRGSWSEPIDLARAASAPSGSGPRRHVRATRCGDAAQGLSRAVRKRPS